MVLFHRGAYLLNKKICAGMIYRFIRVCAHIFSLYTFMHMHIHAYINDIIQQIHARYIVYIFAFGVHKRDYLKGFRVDSKCALFLGNGLI